MNVKMNWGDAKLALKDLNEFQAYMLEILQPLIEQGFDNIEGWFILNLESGINDMAFTLLRGSQKLKVKLFHPQFVRTPNGISSATEENFWCTSTDRYELLQTKCEQYDAVAQLNCPIIDDELFVECDGRVGSAKGSGGFHFSDSDDRLSIVDAIWLGCDRDGNQNKVDYEGNKL